MRALTVLSSVFFPGSGQFGAGHPWRGLAWIAALLASGVGTLWLGLFAPLAVWLAQAVDAGLVEVEGRGPLYQLGAVAACIVVYIAGAVGVRATCAEAFRIPSGNMIPTLQVGDHIMVSKWSFTPSAAT